MISTRRVPEFGETSLSGTDVVNTESDQCQGGQCWGWAVLGGVNAGCHHCRQWSMPECVGYRV